MTTRPHDHTTTRPHDHTTTRPHDHTTTRPHDHARGLKWAFYGLVFLLMGCQTAEVESLSFTSPLDCQNYDEYAKMEEFIYEFFKYGLMNHDFEENIPLAWRQSFLEAYEASVADVEGMDFSRMTAFFRDEGGITSSIRDELLSLYSLLNTAIHKPSLDFQNLQADLDAMILAAKGNIDLSCEEKHSLVLVYYLIKGTLSYLEETFAPPLSIEGESVEMRNDDCDVSDVVWCFTQEFLQQTILGGGGYGLGYIIAGAGTFGKGFVIGAVIGAIKGLFTGASAAINCCDYDCYPITGVSLWFSSCNPAARYTAFGFGSEATSLIWVNENGLPETAVTPTQIPRLTISQIDITQPVETFVFTNCDDGTSRSRSQPIERNLFQLARSTAGITAWGPVNVAPGTTQDYGVFGLGMNANVTVTQWLVSNGTIVANNGTWIKVQWDSNLETGLVQVELTNTCPDGQVSWLTVNVVGDSSGPIQ